jgi:hypothetical protein
MKRILMLAGVVFATTAAAAQAHPPKPHNEAADHCKPRAVGFYATGKLVSQALTQTAGADTSTKRDDRYSGTVTVDVKRANHRAPMGVQTYTLDSDRVHFSAVAPKPGDRVKLYGKLTRARHGCAEPAAPAVDLNRVRFKAVSA